VVIIKKINLNRPKFLKKYFKYENNKIKYVKKLKEENFLEEDKEMETEEIKKKDNVKNQHFNKEKFANKLFTVFLVFSVIFVYSYYVKGTKTYNTNNSNTSTPINNSQDKQIDNKNLNSNDIYNNSSEENSNLTKEEIYKKIIKDVKDCDAKEINKVENYLDLKGNRLSTISEIERCKKTKMDLYNLLTENKNLFNKDKELYSEVENLLIKSSAMSEELLKAFDERKTNEKLEKIINYYKEGY